MPEIVSQEEKRKRAKEQIQEGLKTAFIDGSLAADSFYKPSFVSNSTTSKHKVIATLEDELQKCDSFQISVAFITDSGIEPLMSIFQRLEEQKIPGKILTTDYLCFSEPKALKRLAELTNVQVKLYKTTSDREGFHTKGYIFQKEGFYRIIIGSSNLTQSALTTNREWNTRLISTEKGELVNDIVAEFNELWDSQLAVDYDSIEKEYEARYRIVKHQRDIAKKEDAISLEKYKLEPNCMQQRFVEGLKKIIEAGEDRALLISATGTGKTYASAFGMRENGFKKVLFVVHRNLLAVNALKSFERVFPNTVSMGVASGSNALYNCKDKDFIFAMVNTISKEKNLKLFQPDTFDAIIFDETHRGTAESYQKVMRYFKPKMWLGMTATPDKRDDNIEGRNVYELYHHNIAYEIRLQQAMEEDLLCPFHYFGLSDISAIQNKTEKELTFSMLTSDERVNHIVEQARRYKYSGDKVKGLIFCSKIKEARELSRKLNNTVNPDTGHKFRTIALSGDSSEALRQESFARLAADEGGKIEPLDYILSVEILNEGVDIIEVNQVIMLRPTQSPIIFIQQLGRGLRKAEGKEYVVILDFIGNYKNNFMIPIALSGDRTYNADNIRKYVISGNNIIPGASTVHFDEIAKDKIFQSIDKIKGLKTIIKESYVTLKNRLGRVPYLIDFQENGEVDPTVIIKEYKTYQNLLSEMEGESYAGRITEDENLTLEYLSKTVLNGVRPYELIVLDRLADQGTIRLEEVQREIKEKYDFVISDQNMLKAAAVLKGGFTAKQEETEKYTPIAVLGSDEGNIFARLKHFSDQIQHEEFYKQVKDIASVGLMRFEEKYKTSLNGESPFVLYEKYTRRDVCLLMNYGKDISSTMYGMRRIGDDAFIFVTYKKEADTEKLVFVDGKPDYADEFVDEMTFRWDSQMDKGVNSSYMQDVTGAARTHLLVKKSDAETGFYYMGQVDVVEVLPGQKKDKNGKAHNIAKCRMRMHHPVRDDLLRYLQSTSLSEQENKKAVNLY